MDTEESDNIHQAHDKLFKVGFGNPANTAAFLQAELPARVSALIDWSSLALESGSYTDSQFHQFEGDLLFSVSVAGRPGYIHLLFEHQTSNEPRLALRLLRYMVRIWENDLNTLGANAPLPVILPVVLAQNAEVWKVEPRFSALFDLSAELDCLLPYLPEFTFRLFQLAEVPYEKIRGTPEGILVMRTMKAERLGDLLADPVWDSEMLPGVGRDFFLMLLRYMLSTDVDRDGFERKVEGIVNLERRNDAMTLAQQYRQEGLQEGRQEGILTSRRQSVLEALEIRFEQVPSGLKESVQAIADEEKLRILHRVAIKCGSLEEFAASL